MIIDDKQRVSKMPPAARYSIRILAFTISVGLCNCSEHLCDKLQFVAQFVGK